MISENDDKQSAADRAHLAWGFALSIPLTLLVWVLMSLGFGLENLLKMAQEPPELVTSTSIVHMDRRPIPEPKQRSAEPQVPVMPKTVAQTQPVTHRALPTPATERAELAREAPKATPQATPAKTQQRAATLAETLAQQQVAFEREAATLNANRAPLSAATIDPNNRPRSQQTYKLDYSGLPHATGHGQGYIYPNKSWRDDQGRDCYYGHYTFLYPGGGTEEANIPWAFCYFPYQDPLLRGYPRMIPFPPPMPGYRLPPGTQLERQEAEEYNYWLSTQRP